MARKKTVVAGELSGFAYQQGSLVEAISAAKALIALDQVGGRDVGGLVFASQIVLA